MIFIPSLLQCIRFTSISDSDMRFNKQVTIIAELHSQKNISEEEYGKEEEIFRDPDKLDFRRKHLCINRTNYCSITGVNKTHAILQLNSFIEKGMIHRYGSGKAVVYIQR